MKPAPPPPPAPKAKPKKKRESPGCLIAFLLVLLLSAIPTLIQNGPDYFIEALTGGAAAGGLSAVTTSTMTEEEYLALLRTELASQVGENDRITDITLQNRVLRVTVAVSAGTTLPVSNVALMRAASVSSRILALDTGLWDTVVMDFGAVGTVTRQKSEAVKGDFGYYFDITGFDG